MSHPILPVLGAGGLSKVPIPRLHKQRSEDPRKATINRQNRVSRACLSCRSRKIKCNGLQPRCSNCSDNAAPCVYASSRKDRLKTAVSNNRDMITLLRDLRQQVSSSGQDRIDDLLATVIDDIADAAAAVQQHPADERHERNVEDADVGSSADLDPRDKVLMRTEETGATRLTRKVFEIQSLQKMQGLDASDRGEEGSRGPQCEDDNACKRSLAPPWGSYNPHLEPIMHTSQANFYLDDEILEADLIADPLEMPQFETAERLVQVYMENVHNSFPFLPKTAFLSRFYHYYTSLQRGVPCIMDRKWQATLNLVFAVGSVYSHLTLANWRAGERDNLLYHSRACSLSLDDPWWVSHPSFPHMQITGLLSFYYLSIGHINRSWTLIGMAMRSGIALGMHIPNEGHGADTAKHEIMLGIWRALYAFERHVSALTGRPSLAVTDPCSVPHPPSLSSQEIEGSIVESNFGNKRKGLVPAKATVSPGVVDSSARQDRSLHRSGSGLANPDSYLHSMVDLGEITQGALALYSAKTASGPWDFVQRMIAQGNNELDAWASSLPEGLNFFHRSSVIGNRYRREQDTLDILYQSTKMLITRPCLCRLDRRNLNQSASSDEFNQTAALLCVGAAKSIANLLPDPVADNLVGLYQTGPWWQMVHVITQALVILLLEAVYESMYFPDDRQEVIPSLKKLFRWLRIMRVSNGMAKRAYSTSSTLLKKLVSIIKIDITDLISEEEVATPAAPGPAHSVPTQGHSSYPDILNPVHEMQTGAPLPPLATPAHIRQQQHRYAYDARPYHPESPQYQGSRLDPSARTFHLPSGHDDRHPEIDFDAFDNPFPATSGSNYVRFPGWFVTSFDEQNPLSGFDFAGAGHGSHEEDARQERHGSL